MLQNDATVDFNLNMASPAPGIAGEWFSARWEGQVVPRYPESYTFYTHSDDGVRLWVNGQLLIDNWTYHGWTENSGAITLVAGQHYSIRMEYFQGCCGAVAALLWSSASQAKEVIPSSQLYAARPANGLRATYYNGINLTGTSAIQTDATVNFAWNTASPAPGIPGEWFSARWEGQVVPRYTESYTFYTQSDDGARLWVNGQELVDDWNYHGTTEHSGTITLVAGQSYDIRIEYFQGCCGAVAVLLWSSPSQGKEVIPSSQLFVPSAGGAYRSNGLNQYTSVGGETLTYDNDFNLTAYQGASFSYDAANQLVWASKNGNTVSFVYDGLGRCVKRVVNGSTILIAYDDWKPTVEWDGAGNLVAGNVYGTGPDEILLRWQAGVGYLRYHHDIHGNVAFLLDWNGNGIEKYSYDAFGKPKIMDWAGNERVSSAYGNRFMFQGREYLSELGLYDYRHRMYHPGLGRFLQSDPIGFDAGDMNLFRYCGDDPVDHSDPTGLFDLWGHLKWFFSGSSQSFADWEADRQRRAELETIPFSGAVNETGLGGGNWKNPNVGNHAVDDDEMPANQPGGTKYRAWSDAQRDGSLTVYSDLNWRVAKSVQNKAVVTAEVDDHVRSFRKAETAPNGRIRVALEKFKNERFQGSVGAASRQLNDRLGIATKAEYGQQQIDFHGGGIYWNSHAMNQNPALSRPISAHEVERLIKTLP